MILDSTNKSLEFVLEDAVATSQVTCVASWADINGSSFTAGSSTAQTDDTTAVTIVAAPGSGVQRQIKSVAIHNADTDNAKLKVIYNDNSTLRSIVNILLQPGETLQLAENSWSTIDNNGRAQAATSASGAAGGDLEGAYPNPVVRKATEAFTSGVFELTDGTTIPVDASRGNTFSVTIAGNRTISAPTNAVDGQRVIFEITQDSTGGRTIAWNAAYDFGTAGAPTLSTDADATDYVGFVYNLAATKWKFLAFVSADGAPALDGNYVTLDTAQTVTERKTFTGPGDNNTGSTGHWTGALVTNDITIYPNTDISSSASMFLDNGAGKVWEFFSDHGGSFGVFDKTLENEVFKLTRDDGIYKLNVFGSISNTGGVYSKVFTQTSSSVTVGLNDSTVLLDGTTTIQLPNATTTTGQVVTIKQIASGSASVTTTSSQTIDGSSTYSLTAQYKYVTVQSNGANWFVVGNN